MESVLLSALGGSLSNRSAVHPPMKLDNLDALTSHLQIQAIEKSIASRYATGARDYVKFCIKHNIPLDPTPQTLARYIAYTSRFIASGPKYLTGLRHFIRNFYPNFDNNRAHPIVQATIRGSKKVRADPIHRKQPLRPHHLTEFVNTARCTAESGELVKKTAKEPPNWRKIIKRVAIAISALQSDIIQLVSLPYEVSHLELAF
ncbi:hypothetical protein E4T56_gene3739 [Termitomyces sp. T112]|nr:hypothetical protein E4T56_gene3739 [Termitomyces sp. T112]